MGVKEIYEVNGIKRVFFLSFPTGIYIGNGACAGIRLCLHRRNSLGVAWCQFTGRMRGSVCASQCQFCRVNGPLVGV